MFKLFFHVKISGPALYTMSSDNYNIKEINAILNTSNIKAGIDLRELEDQLLSDDIIQHKSLDVSEQLRKELEVAADRLEFDFDLPVEAEPEPEPEIEEEWGAEPEPEEEVHVRTQEQKKREQINSAFGYSDNANFSFEKEKREDSKIKALSDIDDLVTQLMELDVDLSRVPKVDISSAYEDVIAVLKILRHKNDQARYTTFAEECVLFGAHVMEDLFDGKNTYFSRYSPDLTGWHNVVHMKLRRIRTDTGQLVSSAMQEYNVGPGLRVLLELIPAMVLHSKTRKQHYGQKGVFSDEDMSQTRNSIRNMIE
jgi:hypothetical protein